MYISPCCAVLKFYHSGIHDDTCWWCAGESSYVNGSFSNLRQVRAPAALHVICYVCGKRPSTNLMCVYAFAGSGELIWLTQRPSKWLGISCSGSSGSLHCAR